MLRYFKQSYVALLINLVLILLFEPLLSGRLLWRLVLDVLFTSMIILGALKFFGRGRFHFIIWGFLLLGLAVRWSVYFTGAQSTTTFALLFFDCAFVGLLLYFILADIFRHQIVGRDTLAGAVCAYFLVGVGFQQLFLILESFAPGSFRMSDGSQSSFSDPELSSSLLYYSFVVLTTLGFGDMAPLSKLARNITVIEAICGQMFIGVLIARFVGMSTTRR